MSKLIEEAYKKHKDWVRIVNSFGCPKNISEDIVQEMYVYLIRYEREGKDITYQDRGLNYWYVYKQLRGIYIAYVRSSSKIIKVSLDEVENKLFEEDGEVLQAEIDYEEILNSYEEASKKIYWYERKVFEIIARGKSVAKLSRDADIGYFSLYNTYNKVKNKLKEDLL